MKKLFLLPVLGLLTLGLMPQPSYALSCVDPEGMIDYIVKDPNSIVVTAKVTDQVEYVDVKANTTDPNQQYDSGYTGQFLEISKAHMGAVPKSQWVYFHRNGTWNYLCAGEPPKEGTENIYVIQVPSNVFELQTVTATYPVGSDMANKLLKAIDKADKVVEPSTYDVSKTDWLTRLHDELKEMAFIVKVKLAEWNWWMTT